MTTGKTALGPFSALIATMIVVVLISGCTSVLPDKQDTRPAGDTGSDNTGEKQGAYEVEDTATAVRVTGQDSVITKGFLLTDNYYIVNSQFDGDPGNILLWQLISTDDQSVKDTGRLAGSKPDSGFRSYKTPESPTGTVNDSYYLQVNGTGRWTIEFVRPVDFSKANDLPFTLTGQGRQASPLIHWGKGNVTMDVTYNGRNGTSFYILVFQNDPVNEGYFYEWRDHTGLDNIRYADGATTYTVPFSNHVVMAPQSFDYAYLIVYTSDPTSSWQIKIS